MLKITKNISFPENWNEVIWKDYVKYYDLVKRKDEFDDHSFLSEGLAIFSKQPIETIKQLDQPERRKLSEAILKLASLPFDETPDNSFTVVDPKTKKLRLFQFRLGTFAQFDRLAQISLLNPIDPIAPYIATFFVESKETPKDGWLQKIYKATAKTESNPDLDGYAERLGFIEGLSTQKVQSLFFFMQCVWKSLENHTTGQFLIGLLMVKLIQARSLLKTTKPRGRLKLSPIAWLRYGVCHLTIYSIDKRLKSLISLNGNTNAISNEASKTN